MSTRVVAIVGAGLVGSGWAIVFARAGLTVRVYDPQPKIRDGFHAWAETSLKELEVASLVVNAADTLARLKVFDTLEEALEGATYIQESVFERVDVKTEACLAIDKAMDPSAMVGSSSSGIPASAFTQACVNRARFMINHPVNPPHLVPVVELVPAPWTDPDCVATVRELMKEVGQVPVSLTREVDGFVLNRLQGALLNEAWALYEEGYASIKDIDATVREGLGLRWSFMGPFETIDLNAPGGIADYAERLGPLYFGMGNGRMDHPWPHDVIARAEAERRLELPAGSLADRRAWRDGQLMKLAAFRQTHKPKRSPSS
ncbi:3-hydroxyacyl-CoA dehydrogenase [Martelella limonii]|uniref:3-hydroxyacyl-CoA dehydrogenase n=1 Tax=Martelella limonii TaxID=1647649 RepID=UPI00157FE13C|nr:3-hydroxyacyl-CoA dehydrogenase [Martelella limonii]